MRRLYPLLLLVALFLPVTASTGKGVAADPIQVTASGPDFRSGTTGGVSIFGSAAANEITIVLDLASDRFLVHDPLGAVPGSTGPYACTSVDSATVSCPRLGPRVFALLRAGDDSLSLGDGVTGTITGRANRGADRVILSRDYPGRLRFSGGLGADVFSGGAIGDRLRGDEGPDVLRGRAGNERIAGGTGLDIASGGAGADRLVMNSDDRDEAIKCGAGEDHALIDRDLDPEPRDCERITGAR